MLVGKLRGGSPVLTVGALTGVPTRLARRVTGQEPVSPDTLSPWCNCSIIVLGSPSILSCDHGDIYEYKISTEHASPLLS